MTTMYDSVDASALPSGPLYLGYIDGNYATNYAAIANRFPGATVVPVTCLPQGNPAARVYDCEPGNGNAIFAARWAADQLAAKAPKPCIYTARLGAAGYGMEWVVEELAARGLTTPGDVDLGIADATGSPHLIAGSVFTQWGQGGGGTYDLSTTDGFWPHAPSPVFGPPVVYGGTMVKIPFTVTISGGHGWIPIPPSQSAATFVAAAMFQLDPDATGSYGSVPACTGVASQPGPQAPNGVLTFSGPDGQWGGQAWFAA